MTTVSHPPPLVQTPVPPAHEWAKDTVGAVDSAAEATRQTRAAEANAEGGQSNATTPAHELPGAFPRTKSMADAPTTTLSEDAQAALHSIKRTAAKAQQQAGPAAQNVSQTASGVYASAEQAARQYLPASVVGTLEGAGVLSSPSQNGNNERTRHSSLPSQETKDQKATTSGGVGSLPGSASETSIAKLPEERALEGEPASKDVGEGVREPTRDKVPPSASQTNSTGRNTEKSPPALPERAATLKAPSMAGVNTASQFLEPSTKPAADAPERMDAHRVTSPHSGTQHAAESQATTTSPDSDAQAAERKHEQNISTNASKSAGTSTAYARNQEHGKVGQTEGEPQGSSAPHQGHTPDSVSESRWSVSGSGSGSGDSPARKPSFSQRVKAEAKIIAGKMSKDPKKVEEGKAMKEGHA